MSQHPAIATFPVDLDVDTPALIGDRVAILMNHVCPVVNLDDVLVGVRGGRVERHIPVVARGRRT